MLHVLVLLVVLGLVCYLIDTYIPMSEPFKTIFRVVIVLALCVYLLSLVGIVPLPRLRF